MLWTTDIDLQQTIAHAPVGICLLDASSMVVELANKKFLETTCRPAEDFIGRSYWEIFTTLRKEHEPAVRQIVVSGETYYAEKLDLVTEDRSTAEVLALNFIYVPVKDKEDVIKKIAVWVTKNNQDLAERKKEEAATKAFQQERDRLKSFLMQAPAGISILTGPNLVYELINPAYQQILAGRNLIGRPIFEAVPELVGTPLQKSLLRVYQKGEVLEVNELMVPIADYEGGPTHERYFSFTYQPWRDEHDQIEGILGFVFEVSGMVRIQDKLKAATIAADQQKRVYETIASGTPDLMYVFDLNYRFTYVNQALLSMWGKTWETAVGKGLRENGYEEWHAQMHEREIDSIVLTKQQVRGEVSFPHAVLGKRIYDYILVPVLNEAGEVEAVAGTTRDVSERKALEDALVSANLELSATNDELSLVNQRLSDARTKVEESQIMLRLAIDAASFGTWFIHSNTREFVTDARFKELFGYYADENLSVDQALAQVAEEYRSYVTEKLDNAISQGADYDVTYPVVGLHDKRLRWLRSIGNRKVDAAGGFSAFTGVVMDVTEQKMDEQRKNDFISMVSHEMKTPLTSLNALVQLSGAKLRGNEDPFLAGAMEKANGQVKRMTGIINGFLDVSRLESAKLVLNKKTFSLSELVQEVITETTLTVSTHSFQCKLEEPVNVIADKDKIWSVITNLVSNAVKYSAEGTTVFVTCTVEGSNALVSVQDNGIGLGAADKEKVFDRYFRVETGGSKRIAGFGIGLYVSAEIIRRHEGKIWVDSVPAHGSTFYFTLPL